MTADGGTPSWHVLVCDDEPLFGFSLRRMLRLHCPGTRVVLAADGEGPRLAGALPSVDLIILDLFQPVPAEEQFAAFRALRQTAHTPVVVVSAVGPVNERQRVLCDQAAAFALKPLGEEFLRVVRTLVRADEP